MMSNDQQWQGARVLVTGGAGFIGSHLVDELVSRGARVRVLDDLSTGRRENLTVSMDHIEWIEGDIRSLVTCQDACKGIDFLFHQAALGSVPLSLERPADTIAINVMGTANVFTAARDQGVKRVVYASSSSVYGDSSEPTKSEGREGRLLSPYALSKKIDEDLAATYAGCFGAQIVGLRYFNVYGPRQAPNGPYAAVIPRFFAACRAAASPVVFGTGEQTRDFVFVGDVVRANLAALASAAGVGMSFNVGAGSPTTVNDIARVVSKVTGFAGSPEYQPERNGDIRHSVADTSLTTQTFSWSATTPLMAGLEECSKYYV